MYEIHKRRMQDLPLRQQPRELVDRLGVAHVQNEVLLAVILRSGVPEKNVLELARELMLSYGSFSGMAKASVDDLTRFTGMGRVKGQAL